MDGLLLTFRHRKDFYPERAFERFLSVGNDQAGYSPTKNIGIGEFQEGWINFDRRLTSAPEARIGGSQTAPRLSTCMLFLSLIFVANQVVKERQTLNQALLNSFSWRWWFWAAVAGNSILASRAVALFAWSRWQFRSNACWLCSVRIRTAFVSPITPWLASYSAAAI